MKRLFVIFFLLLAIAAGAMFAFRDELAERIMWRGLDRISALAEARRLHVKNLTFGDAAMDGLRTIIARKLTGEIQLERGVFENKPEALRFEAGHATVTVRSLLKGRMLITVADGAIVMLDTAGQPTGQQISDLSFEADLDVSWRHLDDSARVFEDELRQLVREGSFRVPARIHGLARLEIAGKWHEVDVHSRAEDGVTRLYLDREDVRTIAKAYALPVTEAEIDLVAENPVRAPALLRISRLAFSEGETLRKQDRAFPYDAYRHVYWSWMLTHKFGPEFAEDVTDAHEIGTTYEFGEANRRMDLNNNSVGRAYALAGVREGDLKQRVLSDPNVIRSAR